MPHKFDPRHLERLDRPDRAEWQPVAAFLGLLQPSPGRVYADVGCGVGYFTFPVAERVLPLGKVYALDVEPAMVEELRRRAHERGLTNVIPLRSEENRLPLPVARVDGAWSANTFHEFDAPLALLYEVNRILRPGGSVFLIDWKPEETPGGPPIEERVTAEAIQEALRGAGFVGIREHAIYRYHNVVEGAKRTGKHQETPTSGRPRT